MKKALLIIIFLLISLPSAPNEPRKTMITFTTHITPDSIAYKSTYLLLNEAFHRIGYDFSLQTLPGKRSLIEANNGVFDGEAHRFAGLNDNNEFPNLIKVPVSLLIITNAMFSKRVTSITNSWQDISKYRVTVQRGSLWLTKMAKEYAKEVHELETSKQMLNFVIYGRADIALMSTETSELLTTKEFKNSGIKQIGPVLSRLAIYSFVHKKNKDLAPKLADALQEMKLDGSYQKLIKQN